ncbi:PC-esterase domain-containing protein 1A-like [Micropterus salmoides]|uniref:PC-esterase domain-containing protein 1A-like n=1 Tax=Micropterus salmoides TaxID=27706 RepID=UPI0018EB4043|nr:PC-esterase domain-containing protein 1A-like [Micropterus salmoides]
MKEIMKCVSHQQASQLLHNKFIVVLGDSIQRSVYKDLVQLLQKEKYLTSRQLKSKGEMSFEQDCLVEGGCLSQMNNGTEYREVRQFQSDHHLVRFYFVTRIYSRYMQSILEDFRHGLKPDVIIINSCVWDISRYYSKWIDDYKENLHKFFDELRGIVLEETLVVWNLTMPLGERLRGGFLVPEIEHKAPQLRHDVIEANFYSGTLADAYGMDVLDLHFQFRFSLHHRTTDGVHWNAIAHRRITSLLLQHTSQAWGVVMSCPLTAVEHTEVTNKQPAHGKATKPAEHHPSKANYNGYKEEFFSDSLPSGYLNFEENNVQPRRNRLPVHRRQHKHGQARDAFHYRPPHHFQPYEHHHQYVMRNRHNRHHYAPYMHHRPNQYPPYGHYY